MMKGMCPGCYKPGKEGYCPGCRKQLFDGKMISHVLPFDAPTADNLSFYQKQTRSLSISGVQLKYSVRLEDKELELAETGGQYILKPIPPSTQIMIPDQAPENEHLTMQIAHQVFGIRTAANALIYFRDGTPAYITKRFDIKTDGTKYQQEDMAQLGSRSRQTHGENFKYESTYEEIGALIRQYVAASTPVLENYFKLLLFNYIFSNGDAHLKNFSLILTDMGDYTLTPAYDLMCTVLHTPLERDTALDLYAGDIDNAFYSTYGYYGLPDFKILADKMGLMDKRVERIIRQICVYQRAVETMVQRSGLNEATKQIYTKTYLGKLKRMQQP